MRERGIYRYTEDISIPLASSVRRALDEKRKGGRGGGRERGKNEMVSLRDSISEAAVPTTPVHVGYQIFLLGFLRNRLLRLLSRTLARHARTNLAEGVPLKPYSRYVAKTIGIFATRDLIRQ